MRTIKIYYNNRNVQAVVELKNKPGLWHQAKKVVLQSGQTEIKVYTTSILGLRSSGSCVSSRVILGCVWNCCVSWVKIVTVDFGAEIRSEFSFR